MPPNTPTSVTILAYQVGFGDCFLLRVQYPNRRRHVLIDFGAFPPPRWAETGYTKEVADAIARDCGGKLDMIVVTHRHADHINGFATKDDGSGPGEVIAGLQPDLIVQPWTEDPDARPNANKPTASFLGALPQDVGDEPRGKALTNGRAYVGALDDMQLVADMVWKSAKRMSAFLPADLVRKLAFYGENGISNRSAVKNLITMGERQGAESKYVYYGFNLDLQTVLPGVTVRVLGPPTLEQTTSIKKYARSDPEYWSFRTFWQLEAKAARRAIEEAPLFPELDIEPLAREKLPPHVRWLVHRLTTVRGRELLEIVRKLDKWLNNTSVILLFQIGQRKLLFPGDAQIENWQYALLQPGVRETLADVDLYKVGHHGSLNATPRSLWEGFTRKSTNRSDANRLRTIVSTMADEHGEESRNTEVPRRTLVSALKKKSRYVTTQTLRKEEVDYQKIELDV